MNIETVACLIGAILIVGFVFLSSAIRVVPEYQRLVVFRLGRAMDVAKGPGIVLLIPSIDHAVKVDLREQVREVPTQLYRSLEYLPVSCTFTWYYKVLDPVQSVLAVGNLEAVVAGIAVTTLRAVIGEISTKDIPAKREYVGQMILARLNEVTKPFAVKVTNVEIRELSINDRQKEIEEAKSTVGNSGETQTAVHTTGTVLIGNQTWDAMSSHPIAPKSKVRVKRIVLEVEEDTST